MMTDLRVAPKRPYPQLYNVILLRLKSSVWLKPNALIGTPSHLFGATLSENGMAPIRPEVIESHGSILVIPAKSVVR